MPQPPDHVLALAGDFPTVTDDQWVAAVEETLGGKSVDSLVRRLPEGVDVKPLYTPGDEAVRSPVRRASEEPWGIRVDANHPDVTRANAQLLEDLEGGASQVHVRLDLATRAGNGEQRGIDGVAVQDQSQLGALLAGVLLDLAPVSLDAGASFVKAGRALLALAADHGDQVAGLRLGADPIGSLAATGSLPEGMEQALADLAALAIEAHAHPGDVRAVAVDTSVWHDGGATEELDLAIALATGVAYLRSMTAAGLEIDAAAGQIEFRLPVGVDQFVGIAKLRAFRRLWARVLEVSGATSTPALVHVTLGASLLTRRDPWGNLLRGTVACFSAAVAGADSITVPPFDTRLGLPGDLGRRIARNTQLVLQREGHVGRVQDPAGGSFHVEALTDDLAKAAWTTFQRIEHEGGAIAALVDGHLHGALDRRREARLPSVATRKRPVTGVSEFPLLDERLPESTDPLEAIDPHLPASDFLPSQGPWINVMPILPAAVSQPFEDLRDLAEAGQRPRMLSVNLGPVARHNARATFAANLFASGGVEVVPSDGFDDVTVAVTALADAGTSLAVLCGDDAQYAEDGAAWVEALQAQGATVWVAGRPDEAIPADGWVHLGCDVLAALHAAHIAASIA